MKKRYLNLILIYLLFVVFITSCGQRGTNNPAGITGGPGSSGSNSIVGTWYRVYEDPDYDYMFEEFFTFNTNNTLLYELHEYEWDDWDEEWYLDYYEETEGVYEINGNQITIELDNGYEPFTFDFSINGDELRFYYGEQFITFTRYYGTYENNSTTNSNPDDLSTKSDIKSLAQKSLTEVIEKY